MLKIGVIGVGVMGSRHARAAASLAETELVAIADVNQETVDRVAAELEVPGYTDYRELLARHKLDAVAVATADPFHRAPAVAAMERGLAVLLEKPVVDTLADAEAIAETAGRLNARVMVGHTLRYDARYMRVARSARAGELGELIHLYARRNATTWSGRRIGGRTSVTVFQGVHDFDAIR